MAMTSGACGCLGPQNGEPLCPCQMRAAREHLKVPGAFPAPVPMGWTCPKCGSVYGPFVSACAHCTAPLKITF